MNCLEYKGRDVAHIVVSGHQPAYLPWLGLLHKASLADVFIYMDDVQFIQRDFIHRNRIKVGFEASTLLTIPVGSQKSNKKKICDVEISQQDLPLEKCWQNSHWNSIKSAYSKAPYCKDYLDFFHWVYQENRWVNLAELNLAMLRQFFEWFGITSRIVIGSQSNFVGYKSDLIFEHATRFDADVLITGQFGEDYLEKEKFETKGIKVVHQQYVHPVYPQRFGSFVSNMSGIDLLFNCGEESKKIFQTDNLKREEL